MISFPEQIHCTYRFRGCQGTNENPFKILWPVRNETLCFLTVSMILLSFFKIRTVYNSHVSKFYEQEPFLRENSEEDWPEAKKKPGLSKSRNPVIPDGPSVIIGLQKSQSYQRFAGRQQEVFIQKTENLNGSPPK